MFLILADFLYNLTITDFVNKDGFCYTWDQTTAKQGANEIGSCIYFQGKKYYPGQNKNRYIYQMMSLLTLKMQKLKEFQLIFLEKRHTQNANDSMHSTLSMQKWE